jgi:hypothetical protein
MDYDRAAAVQALRVMRRQEAALKKKLSRAAAERAAMLEWAVGASAPLEIVRTVEVPIGGGGGGGDASSLSLKLSQTSTCGVGGIVWPSALAIARWLAREWTSKGPPRPSPLRVVELGCGCGAVAGLCAAAYGHSVTATDCFAVAHSAELRRNVDENLPEIRRHRRLRRRKLRAAAEKDDGRGDDGGGGGGDDVGVEEDEGGACPVKIAELDWQWSLTEGEGGRRGAAPLAALAGNADVVLAADTLYSSDPAVLSGLAATIAGLLRSSSSSSSDDDDDNDDEYDNGSGSGPGAREESPPRRRCCYCVLAFPTRREDIEEAFLVDTCARLGLMVVERYVDSAPEEEQVVAAGEFDIDQPRAPLPPAPAALGEPASTTTTTTTTTTTASAAAPNAAPTEVNVVVLVKRKKRTEKGGDLDLESAGVGEQQQKYQPASASGGGAEAGGGNEAAGLFL